MVSQYASDAKLPAPGGPANVADELVRHVKALPVSAGMHRVVWDSRRRRLRDRRKAAEGAWESAAEVAR